MFWRYGGYHHPLDEVNLEKFERFVIYSDRHARKLAKHRMTFSGELQYATQGNITSAIDQLENAYNFDRAGDLGLYQDDGSPTPHILHDATSINGVRITYFDYPQGDPAEYATKRTYRVVAEAEYLAAEDDIVSFQETLSFVGNGGPLWDMEICAKGPPIPIVRARRTPQRVIQTGRIVGLTYYYGVPPPVYSQYEHFDRRQYVPESPVKYGNYWLDWPESYAYHFTLPGDGSALALPTIL